MLLIFWSVCDDACQLVLNVFVEICLWDARVKWIAVVKFAGGKWICKCWGCRKRKKMTNSTVGNSDVRARGVHSTDAFLFISYIHIHSVYFHFYSIETEPKYLKFNPFATRHAYMRQLFHYLQWYAGSERVNPPLLIAVLCFLSVFSVK